jgi:hypothetical protein
MDLTPLNGLTRHLFLMSFIPGYFRCPTLSNGTTLIDEGTSGNFFEIDGNKNTVWNYVNPVGVNGPVSQGKLSFHGWRPFVVSFTNPVTRACRSFARSGQSH